MTSNTLDSLKKREEELLRINRELDERKRNIFEDFVRKCWVDGVITLRRLKNRRILRNQTKNLRLQGGVGELVEDVKLIKRMNLLKGKILMMKIWRVMESLKEIWKNLEKVKRRVRNLRRRRL